MAALELGAKEMAEALGMGYRGFQDLKAPFRVVKEKGRTSHIYSLPSVIEAIVQSGRQPSGKHYGDEIDIERERALKLRAERERLEMKNNIMQRNYAPVVALEQALGGVTSSLVSILDAIPLNIKRTHPEIPTTIIRQIEAELTKARNNMGSIELDWEAEEADNG